MFTICVCDVPFDIKTMTEDDDHHIVQGYASTYGNTDRTGDVIAQGAFDKYIKDNKGQTKLLWQHDPAMPIGVGQLSSDSRGLSIVAKMPKSDRDVKDKVMPQLSVGSVRHFSVGMRINHAKSTMNGKTRQINEAEVPETSIVTFPANPKANINSFKSVGAAQSLPIADSDTAWDKTEAISRIRKFTESEKAPSAEYKGAFFWYDAENPDNFTSYHMPFADIVDGELKAVPAALSAVVGALNGARSGANVSPDDETNIKAIVDAYYEKMGKPSPFSKKYFEIADVESLASKRDIEAFLRESGMFSKKAALCLVSKLSGNDRGELEKSGDMWHKLAAKMIGTSSQPEDPNMWRDLGKLMIRN